MRLTSRYITLGIIAVLIGAGIYEIWLQHWSNLFLVIQAIVLSIVPHVLYRRYGIYTPNVLRVGIVLFMFAALFLGQVNRFYERYEWWDIALHAVAGVGLTLIGFILLAILYRESELHSTAFMTSLFAFSFAMTFAVAWEVYEFIIDTYFSPERPMQPSNTDTMMDLVVAMAGGLLVCFGGYRYLRYREDGITARMIREGKAKN